MSQCFLNLFSASCHSYIHIVFFFSNQIKNMFSAFNKLCRPSTALRLLSRSVPRLRLHPLRRERALFSSTPPSTSGISDGSNNAFATSTRPPAHSEEPQRLDVEESVNGRRRQFEIDQRDGRLRARWEAADEGGVASAAAFLKTIFLPTGFPNSVLPSYASHHYWIALETMITCFQVRRVVFLSRSP